MAFRIPAALLLLCLVKKLTVIGIIGNTQGVSKAANPDRKAMKNIDHKPLCFSCFEGTILAFCKGISSLLTSSGFEVVIAFFAVSIAIVSNSFLAVVGIAKLNFFSKLIQDSLQTW